MRTRGTQIFGLLMLFSVAACDVDSFILKGEDGPYDFTNKALAESEEGKAEGLVIDESLMYRTQVTSTYDGEDAVIEVLFMGHVTAVTNTTTIVFAHGNGKNMDSFFPATARFAQIGGLHRYPVVTFDYRGYGKSTGQTLNADSMTADLEAVLAWLKTDLGLSEDRLFLYAQSLGTIPGGRVAAGTTTLLPPKLVLEAPQTSIDALIQDGAGLSLPATILTDFGYDIIEDIGQYSGQLLWIHGSDDDIAKVENAQHIFDAHRGSYSQAEIIEGAGHSIVEDMGPLEWRALVETFLLR